MAWWDVRLAIDAAVSAGVTHIGLVLQDARGHILIRVPEKPSFGVTATLPRVQRQESEPPSATLQRCLQERAGGITSSAYPLSQVFVTENSTTAYFVGMAMTGSVPPGGTPPDARWLPPDEAVWVLKTSQNATSRQRDLAVLAAAGAVNPSPVRRVLLMIRELHRRGFGRLRAATWCHQNGYIDPCRWQCAVVPAVAVCRRNPAMTDDDMLNRLRETLGVRSHHDPFESLATQKPFGWEDAAFDGPVQLADKFFARFRDLCFMGWGTDTLYERWFDMMLDRTGPHGGFYPVTASPDYIVGVYTPADVSIPSPPHAS